MRHSVDLCYTPIKELIGGQENENTTLLLGVY